jgi:putative ATP-dependent endonuclease of OLD family
VNASKEQQVALEAVIKSANAALEADSLIGGVEQQISAALDGATGPKMRQEAVIRASEPSFDRIVSNLRLVLKERGSPEVPLFSELRSNGLGYNNLLYVATILAELDAAKDATLPLLLVEEPEAHLHPQLQTLLADFLAQGSTKAPHATRVQTIVTTHSPTVAAHVPTRVLRVLHRATPSPRCVSLGACGLDNHEMNRLRRMLDVTKATLLFARGVVLVEGITEALLLPVLARRLDLRVEQAGVSVIPMAGVEFATIAKLFGVEKLSFPVAIITDADPDVVTDGTSKLEHPKSEKDGFHVCDRVKNLVGTFAGNPQVSVFPSKVTLEYDLAEAGSRNPSIVFQAWADCYERRPRLLKASDLDALPSASEKALTLWRVLCRGEPTHGKAELAQRLASLLDERNGDEYKVPEFAVPAYIEAALRHALGEPPPSGMK